MTHELYYTSVPAGLQPGDHGFCVVAQTRGLPSDLLAKLKTISEYRELFPPGDPQAAHNPVRYSHLRIKLGSRRYHVLTRACFAGRDYSQRTNKFVHHVVVDAGDLPAGGPAWALQQPGFMETSFDGKPRYVERGRSLPDDEPAAAPCLAWEMETGDAGWAGVLASATTPDRPAFLVYNLGQEPLTLIGEALALLPPDRRWEVTFSTYFCGLPPDVWCQWRCVLEGTDEARVALGTPGALILKLSTEQGTAPPTDLVQAARTGQRIAVVRPAKAVAAESYTPSSGKSTRLVGMGNSSSRSRSPEPVDLAEADWTEPAMPESVAEPPKSRGLSSMIWLMAGLFLGTVLVAAAVLLLELATGHGLLGMSQAEKTAISENRQLHDEKDSLLRARQETEQRISLLEADIKRLQPAQDKENDLRNRLDAANTLANEEKKKSEKATQELESVKSELAETRKELEKSKSELAAANKEIAELKKNLPKANATDSAKAKPPGEKAEKDAAFKLENARKLIEDGKKTENEKKLKDGKIRLQDIIDDYPGSEAAKEAKKILDELSKEK